MAKGEGTLEASMVKAYVCKAAEWVTREAMQIHGGMGYAEEYPVSRYFVDARVLSIFEGADETLCLKVIARRLVEQAARQRDLSARTGPRAAVLAGVLPPLSLSTQSAAEARSCVENDDHAAILVSTQ